jgi:hypothetical protein
VNTISKTAALKMASHAVSAPLGRGTSWAIYVPSYGAKNLSGPTKAIRAPSYWEIRQCRAQWATSLALELLGWHWLDAYMASEQYTGSVRERVNAALSAYQ